MSDLNREQFEKWFEESGFYKFKETAWAAWEASRECMVIELPESVTNSGTAYIETVRQFIEKQGVKTK